MKAGVIVKLPDERVGTVVYNGLDGVGIKWGRHDVTLEMILESSKGRNEQFDAAPLDYPWLPDAMLRNPYVGCDGNLEFVGSAFVVIGRPSTLHAAQPKENQP